MNLADLTQERALTELNTILEGWPNKVECVSCGLKKLATWHLHKFTYPDGNTAAVEITLTRGIWEGWVTYTKAKDGHKAGDYCRTCYQAHKKA